MATKLDAKELVTFRDAILTEAIQFEALVNLLELKALSTGGNDHYVRRFKMKKILAVSLGLLVLLLVGFYFLFPETLFNLAVKAGRHSAGLVKKEIQVDDHKIVYLEGEKGKRYY